MKFTIARTRTIYLYIVSHIHISTTYFKPEISYNYPQKEYCSPLLARELFIYIYSILRSYQCEISFVANYSYISSIFHSYQCEIFFVALPSFILVRNFFCSELFIYLQYPLFILVRNFFRSYINIKCRIARRKTPRCK